MTDRWAMGPHSRNARLGVLACILLGSLAWGCTGAGSRSADETSTALATDALLARASATATAEADRAAALRYVYCHSITDWFYTRSAPGALGPVGVLSNAATPTAQETDAALVSQIDRGRQVERDAAAANCPLPNIEVRRWVADAAHVYFAAAQAAGVPDALNEILNPNLETFVAATDGATERAALDAMDQTAKAWYAARRPPPPSVSFCELVGVGFVQEEICF